MAVRIIRNAVSQAVSTMTGPSQTEQGQAVETRTAVHQQDNIVAQDREQRPEHASREQGSVRTKRREDSRDAVEQETISEVEGLVRERDSLRRKLALATRDRDALQKQLEDTTARADNADREVAKLKEELRRQPATRERFRAFQDAEKATARELSHLRTLCEEKEALLTSRGAELRAAQVYLTKTDTTSYAEVQRMVEQLNAQAFQLSALLTDNLKFDNERRRGSGVDKAYGDVGIKIGEPMARVLYETQSAQDPTWVQTGLQATAVGFAAWIIRAWNMTLQKTVEAALTSIHKAIFENEPQGLSARWRILSARYVMQLGRREGLVGEATDHLIHSLGKVLVISGARNVDGSDGWGASYKQKVRDIVEQSMAIHKAVGEDISSSDLEIICPSGSSTFSTDAMEDVDDCGRNRTQKTEKKHLVLCTTELGLGRREQLAGGKGKSEVHEVVLMKAKVALQEDIL